MSKTSSALDALQAQVHELRHAVERIEVAYVVREPEGPMAQQAFEGLRRQVASAAKSREQHLVHLAQLHQTAEMSKSIEPVLLKLEELMEGIGLVRLSSIDELPPGVDVEMVFEVEGSGPEITVLKPAYCEDGTASGVRGRILIRGQIERSGEEIPPVEQASEVEAGNLEAGEAAAVEANAVEVDEEPGTDEEEGAS
jgi:hypothetical protein